MNFMKKQSAGAWINVITAILVLVSIIVYAVNVGSKGYFQNASITNLVAFSVVAIVLLLGTVVLAQLKVTGTQVIAVKLIVGIMQIIVPVLLSLCLINLIAGRAEGLGFIYFSNPDVILDVQTPENLSSATCAITNMVCLGITTVVAIIAAFFTVKTKEA